MKKYVLIILCLIILTGCELNSNKTYELVEGATIKTKDVEVFSNTKLGDIIEETNMEDLKLDKVLDTETIGDNRINIDYKYEGKEYKYTLTYHVIDTVKPIYLSAAQNITLLVNDDTNPCDNINIADNYSRIPTCEIIGDYTTEKTGTYKVKYQIKDESDNINERNLTINVVKELPDTPKSTPSVSEMIPFESVINKYKKDNTEFGIDVSRWQGDIDFNKVKDAGASFVIMRIGVSNKPEEELSMDSKYKQNIERAKAAGLKVGVYLYTTAINEDMAKTAAEFVVNSLDGVELDYPIVFDWENWSKFRTYQISIHDLNNVFLKFDEELKKHNLSAMLYGSKYYLNTMWEDRVKDNYKVWLAHYTNNMTDYEGKYMMWQMCSDGRIDGIDGDVDIDIQFN